MIIIKKDVWFMVENGLIERRFLIKINILMVLAKMVRYCFVWECLSLFHSLKM